MQNELQRDLFQLIQLELTDILGHTPNRNDIDGIVSNMILSLDDELDQYITFLEKEVK